MASSTIPLEVNPKNVVKFLACRAAEALLLEEAGDPRVTTEAMTP